MTAGWLSLLYNNPMRVHNMKAKAQLTRQHLDDSLGLFRSLRTFLAGMLSVIVRHGAGIDRIAESSPVLKEACPL